MPWIIRHGDPEAVYRYWIGYDRTIKDHRWSNDKKLAVQFHRAIDAERAGINIVKGIKIEIYTEPPSSGATA